MGKVISDKKIAIIGGGHMGSALAQGLVFGGISRARITVSDSSRESARAAKRADMIFIAVRSSVAQDVLREIKPFVEGKLIISLAAGVSIAAMRKILGAGVSLARIMPNISVAYGKGVVGIYAESASLRAYLKKILSGLGLVLHVKKEQDLDVITLIAGCGPGIVSAFIALVAKEARKRGISPDRAEALASQTFKGTLAYIEGSKISTSDLIHSVATKGGVTEAILMQLARGGFEKSFSRAMQSGYQKIKSIGRK